MSRHAVVCLTLLSALVLAGCHDRTSVTAPTEVPCSLAALHGNFGSQRNGQTGPGATFTSVGLATFDGAGAIVERETVSRNGVFSVVTNELSTYTLNADCSGTQIDASGNVVARLVLVHGGDEVLGVSQVPGNNVALHFEKIVGPCSVSTLKGSYGYQRNGQSGPGVPLLSLGTLQADGAGNQTVQQATVRNGVAGAVNTLLGTYAVNADCTGTQSDTAHTVVSNIVVVHGGDEVLGMSMTAGNNVVVHYERTR